MRKYAHSIQGKEAVSWEELSSHLQDVSTRAASFAAAFGWSEMARIAGLLHDIGKVSSAYQAYIASPAVPGRKGPDHSTAGAREALNSYPKGVGWLLAGIIAAHHAGLADGKKLRATRFGVDYRLEPYDGWQAHTGPLPPAQAMVPPAGFQPSPHPGFSQAFLTRMLFSCLVDADFLATEAFFARSRGGAPHRGGHSPLDMLRQRLEASLAALPTTGAPDINALRQRVLKHARAKAALAPGLFTLTVPTGGGKTLTSLAFALEHARRHGLRRVVCVVPFTAIIEQTVDVFRSALGTQDNVLEHHSGVDWEGPKSEEGTEPDSLTRLKRAAENWDAPIVVTTAVQFFESLFASRTSRCRKLHNLAKAVIVLDEAQTLPLPVLRPCMAALEELARNYGSSVVLCTATQPALRQKDGFKGGFDLDDTRELAPEPRALYAALKRVRVEVMPQPVSDAAIATRFADQPQMLCIVNSRAHAAALYEAIRELPGAMHLSTLMCAKHRREVLAQARKRLRDGGPVRLVSTSLIEAGVDISLPEVWRAEAGLDSIAQAAGRCNRHGELPAGRVVVFTPQEDKVPHSLKRFRQAAQGVLGRTEDPLGLEAIRAYFQALYWTQGDEALDATMVDGYRGVLPALAEGRRSGEFPFRSLSEAFRLIDETMLPVVVAWDSEAKELLRKIEAMDRPLPADLRKLQPYTVSVPRQARAQWLATGALRPVHVGLGDALLTFVAEAPYDQQTGLRLGDSALLRRVEENVW